MAVTRNTPEENLITKDVLARAREIDFVYTFSETVKKLMEALSVTRMIPKQAGTNLKTYKATGTLQDGSVPEGQLIPLSKYQVEPVTFAEIEIKKWRKSTTAEAISEKGYDQACTKTTNEMLKDVQRGIRKNFFDFMESAATGGSAVATSVTAPTFQAVLAQAWGNLEILFEDDDVQAVYFMNPKDVAGYLATAQISTQNAFGMRYVQDFLGIGSVFLNASVPEGTVYATAKDNIVLYYIPVNGADLDEVFDFTSDETGFIGIHEEPDYKTMTAEDIVMSGLVLFAERIDGIVIGKIEATETGA